VHHDPASAVGQDATEQFGDNRRGISGLECDAYVRLFGVKGMNLPTLIFAHLIDGAKAHGNWDDSSNKLWSIYVAQAEKYDKIMTDGWKIDTDGGRVFIYMIIPDTMPIETPHRLVYSLPLSLDFFNFLVGSLQLLQPNS
jgi:hypothetical protein